MRAKLLTIVVAGTLFTGCAMMEADETPKPDNKVEKPHQKEKVEPKMAEEEKPIGEVSGKPIYSLKDFKVEKAEFSSLDQFVNEMVKLWADDSEYRSYQDERSADWLIASSVVHYVNYFETDIAALGLTIDFNEWQQIAFDFWKSDAKDQQLRAEFESKMMDIASKL